MDTESLYILARLIASQRTAALGSLRSGAPEVTMVLYAPSTTFSEFWLHLSGLAHHTRNILADPRVSLMIAEPDDRKRAPQTLARVTIQGEASPITHDAQALNTARTQYLTRFPEAETMFALGDFSLYRIVPITARFVAGFGKTFNLTVHDFNSAAAVNSGERDG